MPLTILDNVADFNPWFYRVYPRLSGKGLWLRGGEINTLPPSEFNQRPYRILIVRLSTWAHTVASFTHGLLYQIAAQNASIFPDTAYLPNAADLALFTEEKVPWLLGTGTKRPPLDFDLIAVSNAVVQELVNLPPLFLHSKILLNARDRIADPHQPLIILGGANAHNSGILWHENSPVDGIFAGDSPDLVSRMFSLCADGKTKGLEKKRILETLASVKGFFVPANPQTAVRHFTTRVADSAFPTRIPIPFHPDRLGRGSVPISEGCRFSCTFCSESHTRKPYREASLSSILEHAREAKREQGLERCEIHSFNFNAYSNLPGLLEQLNAEFDQVGLKSQRFDSLARNPDLLSLLHAVGKTSITCGLEGISERLRAYLNKELVETDVRRALSLLVGGPVRELKIFLIATGAEEPADFLEFHGLLTFLRETMRARSGGPRIILSATPLVRFPWTPLAFGASASPDQMKKVLNTIENGTKSAGFEFRSAADLCEWELSQIFCRTHDARVYEALCAAGRETGFLYYRDVSVQFLQKFRSALKDKGIDPIAALRDGPVDVQWSRISPGLNVSTLERRHDRILHPQPLSACNKGKGRLCATCVQCTRTTETETDQSMVEKLKQAIVERRKQERDVSFLVDVDESARGVPRKYVGHALARALMKAEPTWTSVFRRYIGSSAENLSTFCWITGKDVFTLRLLAPQSEQLPQRLADPSFQNLVNSHLAPWARLLGPGGRVPETQRYGIDSPFPWSGDEYLRRIQMLFTVRKENDGSARYEIADRSLKRNAILTMVLSLKTDGGCKIELVAGHKFEPEPFLQNSFRLPHPEDWVHIKARVDWEI